MNRYHLCDRCQVYSLMDTKYLKCIELVWFSYGNVQPTTFDLTLVIYTNVRIGVRVYLTSIRLYIGAVMLSIYVVRLNVISILSVIRFNPIMIITIILFYCFLPFRPIRT